MTITCIGIDLAWSARNRSGGAVVRGDERGGMFEHATLLGGDEEILEYIETQAGEEPCIVGVDAPLWVPNQTGRRPGEAEIGAAFARYQAGAHPANRARLAQNGVVRGEALVAALETRGFTHAPMIEAGKPVRQIIEVFPHPAMVAIFGLARTLKYKVKPNRPREFLNGEWRRYQQYLLNLRAADPPLHGHESLVEQPVEPLKGRALKDYEDRIDALFCAYACVYGYRWGAARSRVFGTMEGGYIWTPVPEEMWKQTRL